MDRTSSELVERGRISLPVNESLLAERLGENYSEILIMHACMYVYMHAYMYVCVYVFNFAPYLKVLEPSAYR